MNNKSVVGKKLIVSMKSGLEGRNNTLQIKTSVPAVQSQ